MNRNIAKTLHLIMYAGCIFAFMLLILLCPQSHDLPMAGAVTDAAIVTTVLILAGGACYHVLAAFGIQTNVTE